MKFVVVVGVVLSLLSAAAWADVYMHNPRGSNDRNCERNVNRQNANRLFDSQNNAKGGYACPRSVGGRTPNHKESTDKMFYYVGSELRIEWTNQHGCGANPRTHCDIVLQYMCGTYDDNSRNGGVRDGMPKDVNDAATTTIPDDASTYKSDEYGMHEDYDYYQRCKTQERNYGLYVADQNLRRQDARSTRQNPNGGRRGFECPEERDYYPYWRPTPWKDIAIMTDDTTRCPWYKANSANVAKKCECSGAAPITKVPRQPQAGALAKRNAPAYVYDDEDEDEAAAAAARDAEDDEWFEWVELPEGGSGKARRFTQQPVINATECAERNGTWACEDPWKDKINQWSMHNPMASGDSNYDPSQGPWCGPAPHSRSNHLGNAMPAALNGNPEVDPWLQPEADSFTWYIPNDPNPNCVLRIRYNISSDDYAGRPMADFDPAQPDMHSLYVDADFNTKDYAIVTQDPYVKVGETNDDKYLSLAINTNQLGRTFQDRSYIFEIKEKPSYVTSNQRVFNFNVRGKRGNIVQTYPAVEYNFVPDQLAIKEGDCVHFQWTGSDYNPRRGCNDAEGGPPDLADSNPKINPRADRSNLVPMMFADAQLPCNTTTLRARQDGTCDHCFFDAANNEADYEAIMELAYLRQGSGCKTLEELNQIKNKNEREYNVGNCFKLNSVKHPYFNFRGERKNSDGLFCFRRQCMMAYMSTRNNNFSNRDVKGFLRVDPPSGVFDPTKWRKGLRIKKFAVNTASGNITDERLALVDGVNAPEAPPEVGPPFTEENDARGEGDLLTCTVGDPEMVGSINTGAVFGIAFACIIFGVFAGAVGGIMIFRSGKLEGVQNSDLKQRFLG